MANDEDRRSWGKLDEQQLIFRQIDNINSLGVYGLEDNLVESWEILMSRLGLSVQSLEALLHPIADEQYQERKEEIQEEYQDDERKIDSKREYYMDLYRALMSLLYRNSVYFGETADFVIDQDEDEEDAAGEAEMVME